MRGVEKTLDCVLGDAQALVLVEPLNNLLNNFE